MKVWSLVLAAVLTLGAMESEAARLGGGKSVGRQSSNVTQREAATPPAAPAQNLSNAATPKPAATPPAAAPAKRPWGAMLGGLAAGLGLAWLAHSLGLGEAFGNILMFALLAMIVMAAVAYFMRKRAAGANASASGAPFAFQGAGNAPVTPRNPYRPENVGNDASARPFERSTFSPDAAGASGSGSMIGSALSGPQNWGVPAGFDTEGFLKAAKTNFVSLQAAWDRADIASLRSMMTDDMLREIQAQLGERERQAGGKANVTEVVMVEAHLLGIEETDDDYLASVEFSGMMREDPSTGPAPFREVWNMVKSRSGRGGWLVAGVQALQ